ncbi:MAG TPA: OFA family MFS transporter [Gemmatimonadaceae bacterium]
MATLSFLHRDRTIAAPGFSRWLIPPAALAIHLCIGQAYAFSVFNLPLTRLIGGTQSAPDDWKLSTVGWVFSLAIVFLGLSAAVFGRWVERVGPRKAMLASAVCFCGGFVVASVAVRVHSFPLLLVGYGALGGTGLGLGYIAPVSTLIKWFPDRPGMATGMAIMGFGGGAMIASPMSTRLMAAFKDNAPGGVAPTFLAMGAIYFIVMLYGVFSVRVPAADWTLASRTQEPKGEDREPVGITATVATRTPQFWLLWTMLLLNVTAGIGVLGQASPMIQEMFPGGVDVAKAAAFVAFLSLCNMLGRFLWSSASDFIGRFATYAIFFALGAVLYALVPSAGHANNVVLFVAGYAVIMSMYGGGFATIPAYLKDKFGTLEVGAIHGRLLTAWSCAGVLGPVLVNYIREYQIGRGVPKADAYTVTMYLMAGLLLIGFAANLVLRRSRQRAP